MTTFQKHRIKLYSACTEVWPRFQALTETGTQAMANCKILEKNHFMLSAIAPTHHSPYKANKRMVCRLPTTGCNNVQMLYFFPASTHMCLLISFSHSYSSFPRLMCLECFVYDLLDVNSPECISALLPHILAKFEGNKLAH